MKQSLWRQISNIKGPGALYSFGDLPLTSSDDSSSRGFLGLFVRLVILAAVK